MTAFRRPAALLLLVLIVAAAGLARADDEPKGGPTAFKRLKFRNIGPSTGGRVARACGVPGDPLVYYAATAAGGVWKTIDGGVHWKPIFDEQIDSAIGSIAVAPSDPNVVYVGAGEANIRGNVQSGHGIYRSSDAGKTWKHVWQHQAQIGTIVVHPTNPDVAFAAVLGRAFGPSEERGVYRTRDGGKTWQRVLFRDRDAGASDVCFDPTNPHVLFAGLWQARRSPWDLTSGGPGSGLYTSRDGGDTWTQLIREPEPDEPDAGREPPPHVKKSKGLPEGVWGKVTVAVAPSDSNRVYAFIEADKGGLFRSNDGGETWSLANPSRALRQRAWYFSTLTIDPTNADIVWFPQVPLLKTIDGGKSLLRVKGPHHGDHHDIWIDPKDPRRIIDSNDGGVDLSINGGKDWFAPPLPIAQFYHVAVDNHTPYRVSGCMQDVGSAWGPSNSLLSGGIRVADWRPVGGGEAGFTVPDSANPDLIYAGEYGGSITSYDLRTGVAKFIGASSFDPSGHAPADLKYRFQWTAPILQSVHDPKILYHAANVLFKTSDAGAKWEVLSGDLTRNDKTKQQWAGGPITGDNTGVEIYGTIFALAESPVRKGAAPLLWAGTDDGLVHVTRDGGQTWKNVTPKGLPEWSTVLCIEASNFHPETAYVVAAANRLDDVHPYLFQTSDGGATWQSLTAKLPQDVFLRVVREDPKKKGLLFLGTERGIQFSTDSGSTWEALKLNFPTVAVTDLKVKDDDLVVGTNGRSLWILDDISPIRAGVPAAENSFALIPPRPAVRYRYAPVHAERSSPGVHPNPPEGAVLHYSLLNPKPKEELTLTILDAKGRVVQTFTSKEEPKEESPDEGGYADDKEPKPRLSLEPGLHRLVWDLKYDGAKKIKGASVDSGDPDVGPLVNPGKYTVRLAAGDKSVTTELEVKIDPRQGDPKILESQLDLSLKIRDDLNRLSRTVEQIRAIRKQLLTADELLKDDPSAKEVLKSAKDVLPLLDALEEKLHNPKAKVSYDILAQKGGAKLYSQLAYLFELAKDADGDPSQGLTDGYYDQKKILDESLADWHRLLEEDLAKLNALAKKTDLPGIVLPKK